MIEFKEGEKQINFSNNKRIELLFPIKACILSGNQIIVLLAIPRGTIFNRNVLSYNDQGEFIWQIEEFRNIDLIGQCPNFEIEKIGNTIKLWNWCGYVFFVNLENGKIISYEYLK